MLILLLVVSFPIGPGDFALPDNNWATFPTIFSGIFYCNLVTFIIPNSGIMSFNRSSISNVTWNPFEAFSVSSSCIFLWYSAVYFAIIPSICPFYQCITLPLLLCWFFISSFLLIPNCLIHKLSYSSLDNHIVPLICF